MKQCFRVPKCKIASWALLRESILSSKSSVNVKTLQRFQGKCISFSLAVPAVKLFIREISQGISRVSSRGLVQLSQELRNELEYWRFLDTWQESVPWRRDCRVRLTLSTDGSSHAWGGVIHLPTGDQTVGDYWDDNERNLNIATKELLSLTNTVEGLPAWVKNCCLDASVDSRVLIGVWEGQGSKKSPERTRTKKRLFGILSRRNLQLQLSYVKSSENKADAPSRRLSRLDSKLSERAWGMVEEAFGRPGGHTIDLIRFYHGPPSWTTSLNHWYRNEATRGNIHTKMASGSDKSAKPDFWHQNLSSIPKLTNSFVEKFAEKNLPIKATISRGYKFFHEEYVHDIEGKMHSRAGRLRLFVVRVSY